MTGGRKSEAFARALGTPEGLRGCWRWTQESLADIGTVSAAQSIPAFSLDPSARHPGVDLWDMWPVEYANGAIADFGGRTLWFVLTAPVGANPDDRHAVARIHLLTEQAGRWTLMGPAFPDGFTPGSREWSGSAVYNASSERLTMFFTAAGRRGEPRPTFEQRLFEASATLFDEPRGFTLRNWSDPVESIIADGKAYMIVDQTEGSLGEIKAFRDPGFFRDPANGREYLFFTASAAGSSSAWNGAIGVAARDGGSDGWGLLPPVVSAEGVNNELERPHMRCWNGRYFLFWSTQRSVFAKDGRSGPTGLYGVTAPTPLGPFTPLNGTGLVAANPAAAPEQAYSWWVLSDGRVNSFANLPGVPAPSAIGSGAALRSCFGGYPTPYFSLAISGSDTRVLV